MINLDLKECIEQSSYFDLIDLAQKQNEIIVQQGELIAKLINEKAEQENFINCYMEENA